MSPEQQLFAPSKWAPDRSALQRFVPCSNGDALTNPRN